MHDSPKVFSLLILPLFLVAGCSDNADQQTIDQSYLDSEEFQEFDQQAIEERSFRSDEATAFERVLSNMLIHPETRELELPAQIDSGSVRQYVDSLTVFEITQSMINEPTNLDYAYYPVGKVQYSGMQVLFFLIEEQSVYEERELAVATFNDSSLIDAQSVAEFIETLSLKSQSAVHIDRSLNIISEITRRPQYPVPQEYNTTYRYTIDSKGRIEEKVLSEGSSG